MANNVTQFPIKPVSGEDVFDMCMTDLDGNDCIPVGFIEFVKSNHHVRSKKFEIENEQGERFKVTITVEKQT